MEYDKKQINLSRTILLVAGILPLYFIFFSLRLTAQDEFRVFPYLQNPAKDAMTVIWFSNQDEPGILRYKKLDTDDYTTINTTPEPASSLAYTLWEDTTFFQGTAPAYPYRHRLRLDGLEPATTYEYIVNQGSSQFSDTLCTAPPGDSAIRFIVYADSETEPESTGKFTSWPDPVTGEKRDYLVDQTTGYQNNLELIQMREPDLVIIAGDLVQSGGEQRDWDEFWLHNSGTQETRGLASSIPLLAAQGNHEYYNGPETGGFSQPASEEAINRYLTYFEYPDNNVENPAQEGRYYALEYGPAAFIILDACNNSPDSSDRDTNFMLQGENDPGGGNAPDFMPGSEQYHWLENKLAEYQEKALFTFVIMHHAPYSSGPHGYPAGLGKNLDNQSGVPVRNLTPLFLEYGVDAVFSGHDEMWERSEIEGTEIKPDASQVARTIHFYDAGTGGDGLRGPYAGTDNPFQVFLAHTYSPEVWEDSVLISGGKHYGHLEVNIIPGDSLQWQAMLDPVYVLPVKEEGDSLYHGYKRQIYDDRVTIKRKGKLQEPSSAENIFIDQNPATNLSCKAHPNPFHSFVDIIYTLPEQSDVTLVIFDLQGRTLLRHKRNEEDPGNHIFNWDGSDQKGNIVPPGIYSCQIRTDSGGAGNLRLIRY